MCVRVLLLLIMVAIGSSNSQYYDSETEEPVTYYYALEESERSLPACGARQACSALVQRYWRPPGLVRLCDCGPRVRCDLRAPRNHTLEINNRAHAQFCHPTTDWRTCEFNEPALTVTSLYPRMSPDELERAHHQDVGLEPPLLTAHCKCPSPNYWKLNSTKDNTKVYTCGSMPICTTDEFCGHVSYDLNALYQSCLCPARHMCVHGGGVTSLHVTELLYAGWGWKAYCRRGGAPL